MNLIYFVSIINLNLPTELQSYILLNAVSTGKAKPEILERVSKSFFTQINNPAFGIAILRLFADSPLFIATLSEKDIKERAKHLINLIDRVFNCSTKSIQSYIKLCKNA